MKKEILEAFVEYKKRIPSVKSARELGQFLKSKGFNVNRDVLDFFGLCILAAGHRSPLVADIEDQLKKGEFD